MRSHGPVWVYATVNLPLAEAQALVDDLRQATLATAHELKSKQVLAPKHRPALLRTLEQIGDRADIYILDKSYYVTALMIDLLVGAHAAAYDVDLASSGKGWRLAVNLHQNGPSAVGGERWNELLTSFNDVIRTYARAGTTAPSAEIFFNALMNARQASTDGEVAEILDHIWDSRYYALDYEGASPTELREMDPMARSLNAISMSWRIRLGDVPFEFLLDRYDPLDNETRQLILDEAHLPLSVNGVDLPRADLRDVRFVDSREDARIQVADILAGIGQEVARLALNGEFNDDLQIAVSELLDANGMWSRGSPLDVLLDLRPPSYAKAWLT